MKSKWLPILISFAFFFGLIYFVFGTANFFKNRNSKPIDNSATTIIPNDKNNDSNTTPKPSNAQLLKSGYDYKNENNGFNTYFPSDFINTNSNIKFEKNGSYITFSPLNNRLPSSGKNDQNQIIYPKIFKNGSNFIDLRYTIQPTQLIEEYIVYQKQNLPKLEQKVNIFDAYPEITNNSINFYKPSTNKLLWSIPAPYMYEQNNPKNLDKNIKFSFTCESPDTPLKDCRSFIFTKEITPKGQNWLNDPSRNYPVIIDPFIDGQACWGIASPLGGYCDSNCANTATTPSTVYTTCTDNSCWQYNSSCDAGCDKRYYNAHSTYISLQNCYDGLYPTTRYAFQTDVCVYGTSTCYKPSAASSGTYYYDIGGGSCSSRLFYSSYPVCSWAWSFSVSGSATKYTGNGTACSGDGSGSCYKLTNGTTFYTGNGSSSSGCPSGTYYDQTTCTWFVGASPGTTLKFERLKIEKVLVNKP